ncbi:MAG: hypothetical protein SPG34_04295 [Trueperella sp.]|uniref:hypothetical protein n=1 Tax=Trueperella sp. TaxID=2699835 RepID=UPI002A91F52B|nr:hypothetical protein [Trueperella sp.]MDY5403540.1 hypothetical protein [Trueperella sp.]
MHAHRWVKDAPAASRVSSGVSPRVTSGVSPRVSSRAAEPGMVTAEFAITLPAVILVALALISMLAMGWKQVEVANEAKEIAREYSIQGGTSLAEQATATGADVKVGVEGQVVTVTVTRHGRGLYAWLEVDFTGTHRAMIEPGSHG